MQSYLELKAILEKIDGFSPIDFHIAETLMRLFPIVQLDAKLWLVLMVNQSRQGAMFFNPDEVTQQEKMQALFENYRLQPFGQILSDVIQQQDEKLSKPIIEIGNRYIFQKDFDLSINWIKRLINLLSDPLPYIEGCLDDEKHLSEEQRSAIYSFFKNKWVILTGGPGRGKTFTAKKIVSEFLKYQNEALLVVAAPTGKAAENLAQMILSIDKSINLQPKTVHALLKISPGNLSVDETDLIDADLLIIDECSMLDLTLFSLLIKKIRPTTRVLLIGDEDQLPPIKGFSPLSIMIEIAPFMDQLSVCKLTIPFRTDQKDLIALSDAVLKNDHQILMSLFLRNQLPLFDPHLIFPSIDSEIDHFITYKSSLNDENKLYNNKIITSHNIGPFGANEINQYFLKILKSKKNKKEILIPIIFSENDEKLGIYNGKMAFFSIFDDKPQIFIHNKEPYSPFALPKFDLAFAISIHKSQGSEYQNVKIVFQSIQKLSQELIYTAVTRAKKSLTLFGNIEDLIVEKSRKGSDKEFYKQLCLKIVEESTLKQA